jgi:hypothetical protein
MVLAFARKLWFGWAIGVGALDLLLKEGFGPFALQINLFSDI